MPRTKVVRKTRQNRLAAIREEVIREYDSKLQQLMNGFDWKIKQNIQEIDMEIDLLKTRIPQKMLAMKMGDLMDLRVRTFSDIEHTIAKIDDLKSRSNFSQFFKKSKDDEGYLTEDSRETGKSATAMNVSRLLASTRRNPGPLSSAKTSRRRSRSACGSILQIKSTGSGGHTSRMMTRTPLLRRQKAFSADRTVNKTNHVPNSPAAFLRWPKPGELVVSVSGSPVVAQVVPESFANVNIPTRDGVISLRPKKLQNVDPNLVQRINRETLSQIKLLQSNLELIMSFARKK